VQFYRGLVPDCRHCRTFQKAGLLPDASQNL
jgi:hypothetical protein